MLSPASWPEPPRPPPQSARLANKDGKTGWGQASEAEHPALSSTQLAWERRHRTASKITRRRILDVDISVAHFKSAAAQLEDIFDEQSKDGYGLRNIGAPAYGVAVDIGASNGIVSVLLAKLFGLQVLAVEPVPTTYRYMLWTLRLNGVLAQVWPVNAAAQSRARWVNISHSDDWPAFSRVASIKPDVKDKLQSDPSHVRLRRVPAVSLERLVSWAWAWGPRGAELEVLKIDCEGCEFDLLASPKAQDLVRSAHVLVGELHSAWTVPSGHEASMSVIREMCRRPFHGRVAGCRGGWLLADLAAHLGAA